MVVYTVSRWHAESVRDSAEKECWKCDERRTATSGSSTAHMTDMKQILVEYARDLGDLDLHVQKVCRLTIVANMCLGTWEAAITSNGRSFKQGRGLNEDYSNRLVFLHPPPARRK